MPLSWWRYHKRGYNQATLVAQTAAEATGHAIATNALRRRHTTKPQTELPREERLKNVQGIFSPTHTTRLRGQPVILLDDVMTTSATLKAAGAALWLLEPRSIMYLALAH